MPMLLTLNKRARGFQNLVGTTVYGGHNLPPLIGEGLRWLPKLCVDTSPCPHSHRVACIEEGGTKYLGKCADVLYGWPFRTFEDGGVFTLETYIPYWSFRSKFKVKK